MSTVQELISTPPARTPFDIVRVAYVELRVRDLVQSEAFYADHLGMIVGGRGDGVLYLRGWEERMRHSLILRQGDRPAVARIGFLVQGPEDLEALVAEWQRRALDFEWVDEPEPGVGRALRVWDSFGFPLEFVCDMDRVPTQHQRFDIQRGAPILRFDHVNFHTPRLDEAFAFWTGLGFRCSEYISTDEVDEQMTGAWLFRAPLVHDVALTAGTGPRLHHFAYWLGEPAAVLRACDQLAAAGESAVIERGPGRHGVSNAFFVYLRDPDGHRIELYSCDYYTGDPQHEPLRWSVNDARCRSFWGTKAPDRWYDESSEILSCDGALLPTRRADVDERDQRSEVLA